MNQPGEKSQQNQSLSLPEELTITPIRGYRAWGFIVPEGKLVSQWDKSLWPVDEPRKAACWVKGCDTTPSEAKGNHAGYGCGLYAWHRSESVRANEVAGLMAYLSGHQPKYWGVVETVGNAVVVSHSTGFRASNMRILALSDTGRNARLAANHYGIPCLPSGVMLQEYPPQVPFSMQVIGR